MRKRETESSPLAIIDEDISVPSRGWDEMIRRVYEIDPLLCPRCGGKMRVIAFVEEPKVIDKVTKPLKLTFEAERPPLPQVAQHKLLIAAEEWGKYF